MYKKILHLVFIAAIAGLAVSKVQAQGLKKRWGWGVGLGIQQLYSDSKVTPFGPGGNALLTYRLSDRLSLSVQAGYSVVKFKPNSVPNANSISTKLIYGDIIADYELTTKGIVRPFFMGGLGGFNFQVASAPRFNDGEILAGGGFRVFLNPVTALTFAGDARLTTGDDLDAPETNGRNDSYFSLRSGVTFYMGPKTPRYTEEELFTRNDNPVEQLNEDQPLTMDFGGEPAKDDVINEDSEGYNDFLARISALEGSGDTASLSSRGKSDVRDMRMEEYLRLKSKIDELSSAIEDKEGEISNLQENLQSKGEDHAPGSSAVFGSGFSSSGPIEITSFSAAYETALNRYYRRRYTEAIRIFEKLLQRFPNHSLASNCEFWIGESYFGAGDFNNAIRAFERVIQYPKSLKKDDALLMIGRSYMALNMNMKAQEAFNKLIQEYPNSEFVIKSEQYLRKL